MLNDSVAMKKTFPLQAPGRDDARVRDKIRHEVNKAVRRARRKPPQEGFKGWDFACKVGASEADAEIRTLREIATEIDSVAAAGAKQIYLEIKPIPARRIPVISEELSSRGAENSDR